MVFIIIFINLKKLHILPSDVLRLCAAPHADGTVTAWGHSDYGGIVPALTGVCNIFSTTESFAALQADRAVMAWGHSNLAASPLP